jgi:hypothetical protein
VLGGLDHLLGVVDLHVAVLKIVSNGLQLLPQSLLALLSAVLRMTHRHDLLLRTGWLFTGCFTLSQPGSFTDLRSGGNCEDLTNESLASSKTFQQRVRRSLPLYCELKDKRDCYCNTGLKRRR